MVLRLFLMSFCLSACAVSLPWKKIGPKPDATPITQNVTIKESASVNEAVSEIAPAVSAPSASPIWQERSDKAGLEHLASGFICPFRSDDFVMTGQESFAGLGEGNDVACVYEAAGREVKVHLTHFGRVVSPFAHLKGVETNITEVYPVASNITIPSVSGGRSFTHAAAFELRDFSAARPDVALATSVWIEVVANWHVKIRATYESDRDASIAALVTTLYAEAYDHISPAIKSARPTTPEG